MSEFKIFLLFGIYTNINYINSNSYFPSIKLNGLYLSDITSFCLSLDLSLFLSKSL